MINPNLKPQGDRYRPVYSSRVGDDGIIELVESGVEDLQAYINSFKDDCDVNTLVARYAAGDVSALNRGNPVFMDLVNAPKTLAEAYALNVRAEAAFDNLPVDIRNKFDNNYFKFLSAAGTDSWFDILGVASGAGDHKEEVKEAVPNEE